MALKTLAPTIFAVKGLMDAISKQFEKDGYELKPVFDPALSVQTSVSAIRTARAAKGLPDVIPGDPGDAPASNFPALGFNYTILQWQEPIGRRGKMKTPMRHPSDPTKQLDYHSVLGQFDISMGLYHNDPAIIDMYETALTAGARLSNIKQFQVVYPEPIGPFDYYVDWGTVDEKIHSTEGAEFIALTFVARVRGVFWVLDENPNLLVDRIYLDTRDWSAKHIYHRVVRDRETGVTQIPEGQISPEEYDLPSPGDFPES